MALAQEGRYDPDDPRIVSARNHFCNEVPIGHARTLGYLGFGIALIWDHLTGSRPDAALDVASRLRVAVEQAAIDSSKFDIAWPLTHLPEPPWSRLHANQPKNSEGEPRFATLSNLSWVTTTLALKKDLAQLAESREKGRGKGDKGERSEASRTAFRCQSR